MDTSARQRLTDGAKATDRATGRLEARAAELLVAALRTEETRRTEHVSRPLPGALPTPSGPEPSSGAPSSVPGAPSASSVALATHPAAEGRTERALALVERIERLVRSGRPSLALTLRDGVPGQLEVQRVARGTVALRISSPRPPSAGELGELRQALEARGLSVRSFEARLTASAKDACSPCP